MITVKNIIKKFGALTAVDGVSFDIIKGDSIALVGASGCGKSTLAKMLMGFIKPDGGSIEIQGRIQMVFQDPYQSLDPMWSIKDILMESFLNQKMSNDQKNERIDEILEQVELSKDILIRKPHAFSGGQRQRIAIARALLAKPDILILDEATSALDVLVAKQIMDLLMRLKKKHQLTYIFISHNLRFITKFSDKIMIMDHGKIIESNHVKAIMQNPIHPQTQRLWRASQEYTLEAS